MWLIAISSARILSSIGIFPFSRYANNAQRRRICQNWSYVSFPNTPDLWKGRTETKAFARSLFDRFKRLDVSPWEARSKSPAKRRKLAKDLYVCEERRKRVKEGDRG